MVTTRRYNRIVWVVEIASAQNDQGGNIPGGIEVARWKKWAAIQDRSGSNQFTNQQQVWDYDYKIMMRFERTRPTKSNYMIEYEGHRLKIESLSLDSEGYKDEEVCRCSKVDEVVTIAADGFRVTEDSELRVTMAGDYRVIS